MFRDLAVILMIKLGTLAGITPGIPFSPKEKQGTG
jgi:hypothetical protein